ncbi:MAG: peptide-N-glycosidase F-related protein [Candidatus Binatia bacterium]
MLACAALLAAREVAAKKPRPQPCAPGRYLVDAVRSPLLAGVSPAIDAIQIDAQGHVTLDGCGPAARGVVKANRFLTLVKATWATCGTFSKLSLRGKIGAPACDTLGAKLKARKLKPKPFAAARSRCGDHRLDTTGGEACDASQSGGDAACPGLCGDSCACGGGCVDGLAPVSFDAGATGVARGELAADFTVDLVGGGTYGLQSAWTGCESFVFIPDTLAVSALDPTSLWAADIDALVAASPPNVHYFFVSRAGDDDTAAAATTAMKVRVDALLSTLSSSDAARWAEHLHVVAGRAATYGNWLTTVLAGHGSGGFGIDRSRRVRDVGSLADVSRFSSALQNGGHWPWKNNLAYAAYEPRWYNGLAQRAAEHASDTPTIVPLWSDATIATSASADIVLADAGTLATFDTLEVDVQLACPDPTKPELATNCGAFDYIASLMVTTPQGDREIARAVTPFHREAHWVVDATPWLPLLTDGGSHHFTWTHAPDFAPQPTRTTITLRFGSRGKGMRPTTATYLWGGGDFTSAYNTGRVPAQVAIPSGAKRVELVAVVSGHGSGANQCAEFCNHQHEFTVDGAVHLTEFPTAGVQDGCLAAVPDGMTPNQGGTWWFGRGGWCPGEQVAPVVIDVTSDVTKGANATISYRGLFGGAAPPDNAGTIDLASWLVVYE